MASGYVLAASSLRPSDAHVRHLAGSILGSCGRQAEAVPHMHQALALAPRADTYRDLGALLIQLGGRDDESHAALRAAVCEVATTAKIGCPRY